MRIILDFDDLSISNMKHMWLLDSLKDYYPNFKVNLFAIPMQMSDKEYQSIQDRGYVQLIMHGWEHDTSTEAWGWRYKKDIEKKLLYWKEKKEEFSCLVEGFKAPGWWITPQTVDVLNEFNWWVAVNPKNPSSIYSWPNRAYLIDWGLEELPVDMAGKRLCRLHGHMQDTCGNGLLESAEKLVDFPRDTEFVFIDDYMRKKHERKKV